MLICPQSVDKAKKEAAAEAEEKRRDAKAWEETMELRRRMTLMEEQLWALRQAQAQAQAQQTAAASQAAEAAESASKRSGWRAWFRGSSHQQAAAR